MCFYSLVKTEVMEEKFEEDCGVYMIPAKTRYHWIPSDEEDEYMGYMGGYEPDIHATIILRNVHVDQIVDIGKASMDCYNDHYEPDAVLTSTGWRCDV